MKKVKIAKYTKEKNKEAWRVYREENRKRKYNIPSNMTYIVKEAWRSSKPLFVAT
ncbi:MAG: hypothetical protein HDT47_03660, partial [Ruminococcaceae bacterium]|nr:hypothetical protein [Oscillospiraceae bacterium]